MTPLQLNALAGLLQNQGLIINPTAAGYYGSISNTGTLQTRGTLNTATVLDNLTRAINLAAPSAAYYAALTSIGSATIPALGNSKPSTYTITDTVLSYGFIGRIALQALYEYNQISTPPTTLAPTSINLSRFTAAFQQAFAWKTNTNKIIVAAANAATFRQSAYSNMNDLITAEITGITLATQLWGNDLINAGLAIDLSNIDRFGNPAVLLKTLTQYNAVTDSLALALGTQFSPTKIESLKAGVGDDTDLATLYACFSIITGQDLQTILDILNVKTTTIQTLADLLSPLRMFPNSASTLTYPMYGVVPGSSKMYDFIYVNSGVNPRMPADFASKFRGILPADIASAAYAFSLSMMQIKNIKQMQIGPFAQVVANIETSRGLPLINNPGSPASQAATQYLTNTLARGSGPAGTYTMASFFGAISGVTYTNLFSQIQSLIRSLQTNSLANIYLNIYNNVLASTDPTANITAANAEIAAILAARPAQAAQLNALWRALGTQLQNEINLLSNVIGPSSNIVSSTANNPSTVQAFTDSVAGDYATDTGVDDAAVVLEAVGDLTNLTGQSIVGLMRRTRNDIRVTTVGGEMEDNIPEDTVIIPGQENPNLLPNTEKPNCTTLTAATSKPRAGLLQDANEDSTVDIKLNILSQSCASTGPGSTANSIYTDPEEVIQEVTVCNCECWQE